jgi:hypothetical protein
VKFLNGWKTITGLVGTLATVLIASGGKIGEIAGKTVEVVGHLDSVALGVFGALTAIGIIHKAEKKAAAK